MGAWKPPVGEAPALSKPKLLTCAADPKECCLVCLLGSGRPRGHTLGELIPSPGQTSSPGLLKGTLVTGAALKGNHGLSSSDIPVNH